MNITIVVPLYNEEESLPELYAWIERVMKENNFSYEVIFINDGSTDNSPAIIREYMERDARVKLIDKANSGYGDSMNRGLEISSDIADSPASLVLSQVEAGVAVRMAVLYLCATRADQSPNL